MSDSFQVLPEDYRPPSWHGDTFPMDHPAVTRADIPRPMYPAPAPPTEPWEPAWTGPQRTLSVVAATVTETSPPPGHYFPDTPSLPLERLHVVWDSFGDARLGIQACGGCGAVYTDDSLRDVDDFLIATRKSAGRAGWAEDALKVFRCPGCHEKHEAELAARPKQPGTGPGTEAYEANLAKHLAFLVETGNPVTVVAEVQLRAADLCHFYGIGEAEAVEQAAAVVAERRAAA